MYQSFHMFQIRILSQLRVIIKCRGGGKVKFIS
jgi:hypothetical protein